MCLESSEDSLILVEPMTSSSGHLRRGYCFPHETSSFIHIVFFGSADRYVVLGAQRDAWGKGYAKATVGTSVLIELAKAVRQMVEKGNTHRAVCRRNGDSNAF